MGRTEMSDIEKEISDKLSLNKEFLRVELLGLKKEATAAAR